MFNSIYWVITARVRVWSLFKLLLWIYALQTHMDLQWDMLLTPKAWRGLTVASRTSPWQSGDTESWLFSLNGTLNLATCRRGHWDATQKLTQDIGWDSVTDSFMVQFLHSSPLMLCRTTWFMHLHQTPTVHTFRSFWDCLDWDWVFFGGVGWYFIPHRGGLELGFSDCVGDTWSCWLGTQDDFTVTGHPHPIITHQCSECPH